MTSVSGPADGVELTASNAEEELGQECGDGGYHEAFKEYCLYARRRYCLEQYRSAYEQL